MPSAMQTFFQGSRSLPVAFDVLNDLSYSVGYFDGSPLYLKDGYTFTNGENSITLPSNTLVIFEFIYDSELNLSFVNSASIQTSHFAHTSDSSDFYINNFYTDGISNSNDVFSNTGVGFQVQFLVNKNGFATHFGTNIMNDSAPFVDVTYCGFDDNPDSFTTVFAEIMKICYPVELAIFPPVGSSSNVDLSSVLTALNNGINGLHTHLNGVSTELSTVASSIVSNFENTDLFSFQSLNGNCGSLKDGTLVNVVSKAGDYTVKNSQFVYDDVTKKSSMIIYQLEKDGNFIIVPDVYISISSTVVGG